ncbi:hypothetical protein BACSP_00801 [Bacillus sp. T2.9-1]|nr:hypothetical protein BACSP_00801 [Bacillus sp. T2.9-1]
MGNGPADKRVLSIIKRGEKHFFWGVFLFLVGGSVKVYGGRTAEVIRGIRKPD